VKTDGSQAYRILHHRSRDQASYYTQPRAALSHDQKYIIFDSNMAYAPAGSCPSHLSASPGECEDVYLVRIQ
jgi:hypothetical protein